MRNAVQTLAGATVLAGMIAAAPGANATLIDVQFRNVTYGTVYTGPAVQGAAGDVWNQMTDAGGCPAPGCSATNVPLVDALGNPVSATFNYSFPPNLSSGPDTFSFQGFGGGVFVGTPYADLMNTAVFVNSRADYHNPPAALSFGGLTPGAAYDLVLYSAATNRTSTPEFATQFTVNGAVQVVQSSSANTFAAGENYAEFTAVADPGGDISISMIGLQRAYFEPLGFVNAVQLSYQDQGGAIPEPGSLALLTFGLLGLATVPSRIARRMPTIRQ